MHPCESVELAAVRDFFAAAPGALRDEAGIATLEIASATCFAVRAAPDVRFLNRVVGLGIGARVTDRDLEAIDAFFAEQGVRYQVALAPEADPGLAGRLAARGFESGYAWMKFERGPIAPPEARTELRVEEVRAGAGLGAVAVRAFGLPSFAGQWCDAVAGRVGWHCFAALDGERPAGYGVLHVAGGAGWLGLGATLPEYRGRGAQSALLSTRIRRALEIGCDRIVTETGERLSDRPSGSYRNILRAGFAEAYLRPNYLSR